VKTIITIALSAAVLVVGIIVVNSRLGQDHAKEGQQAANVTDSAPGMGAGGGPADGHLASGDDAVSQDREATEVTDLDLSVDEILARVCEHDKPAYTCADCRYQVGVVQVGRALTERPAGGAALITVTAVETGQRIPVILVTGEVGLNENRRVRIRPRTSGVVRSMKVDIGAHVRKGDLLFEIESAEIGLALREYQRTRTMVELAGQRLERERTAQGRDPSSDWDLAGTQMAYEEYATELKGAEAGLRALGFTDQDLDRAPAQSDAEVLGRIAVRAPMSGSVIEKYVAEDEWVEPSDEIVVLADLNEVWVWAHLYEHDLGAVLEGQRDGAIPVEVVANAFPGRSFSGVIDYIASTMDEESRTIRCRATIENQDGLLRPGMYCDIRIQLAPTREAKTIPRVGLLTDEGRTFVFRHLTEDYFVRRPVTAGPEQGDAVEVLAGLDAGEIIVADGAFLLKSDVLRTKMGAA